MRPSRLLPALLLTFLLAAGCGDTAAAPQQSVTVTQTDSATLVRVASLAGTDVPQWNTAEVFSTAPVAASEPGGGVELFQVTSARFLPDGRLAVANAGTGEIFLLDDSGRMTGRLGGKGEGPGEFTWISALDVDSTGTLVAYDSRQGRLTRFTADGPPEPRPFAPPNRIVDLHPLAFLRDGRVAAIYGDMRFFAAGGEKRDTTPLMIFQPDGSSPDTVGMWPATEWAFMSFEGGASRSEVGFGRSLVSAGRNSRYAVGANDSIAVTVFDATGRAVMHVTGAGGGSVPATDVDAWNDERLGNLEGLPEAMRNAFRDVPHRTTLPGFGTLVIDDEERLWIGSYVRPSQESREWLVLGSDGNPLGRITTPGDARVLDIAGGRVALLHTDELDEQSIVVMTIRVN